jgi:hypothetical protein
VPEAETGVVAVFDLSRGQPDYEALLRAVFGAERISVW